ncbi:MAG: hypothetical protein BMS9Abin33_1151 [Gammaproteobacteria bacterium]|nr:MAG: hypothetical protein BMS9Abin33_1151 [Gammaproteobacteria bacterium]
MAKKYIDQDLFDYFVCFVALTSLVSEHSESEVFDMGWKSYEADLIDDGIKDDVLRAVNLAKSKLVEMDAPSHPAFFKHFQEHIEQHNSDGSKKSALKKAFGGMWFAKSDQNPNRVQDFLNRMLAFYAGLITGAYGPQ